jgi:hypothetical protein
VQFEVVVEDEVLEEDGEGTDSSSVRLGEDSSPPFGVICSAAIRSEGGWG